MSSQPIKSNKKANENGVVSYSPNDTTAPLLQRFHTTSDLPDNGILMNSGNHSETVNEYRQSSVSSEHRGSKINFTDFSAHGHGSTTGNGAFKKRHFSYGALGGPGTSPTGQLYYTHHNFYNQLQQYGSRISLGDAAALELPVERLENLQEMRPLRLIGKSCPMRDWNSLYKSEEQIKQISRASVIRDFYFEQNDLIERYQAIDRLLDSGMPQSMLRVYGDDLDLPNAGSFGNATTTASTPSTAAANKTPSPDNGIADTLVNGSAKGSVSPNSPPHTRLGAPANIDIESSPLLGESREEKSNIVMFAIYVNFFINFVLLCGKTLVVLLTNSLSVVASLVDSVLDFLSTFIIWISTRLVDQRDWKTRHLYPVGRSRLEPIGVLVFSVLIIVSFLKVGDEAVNKLLEGRQGVAVDIGLPSVIIMSLTVIVKVFCYLWCRSIESSAVQALAQDAMTDIVFK